MRKIFSFLATMMVASMMASESITVAEAISIAKGLGAGKTSTETYTVVGYVAKLQNQYNNGKQSFYMSDTKNDPAERFDFEAYFAAISEAVELGYKVSLTGKLTNYQNSKGNVTYEIMDGQATILEKGAGGDTPVGGTVMTGMVYADAMYYDGYWGFDLYKDYSEDDELVYPEFYAEFPATSATTLNGTYTLDEESYAGYWKTAKDSAEFASGSMTVTYTGKSDDDEYPIYQFSGSFKDDDDKTYTINVSLGVYAYNYDDEEEITLQDKAGGVTPTPVGTTITVAEAEAIAGALGSNETTTSTYTIVGYAGTVYSSGDFYLLDVAGTKSNLQVYKPTVDRSVATGDKVQVVGKLKNYSAKSGKTVLEVVSATVTHVGGGDTPTPTPTPTGIKVADAISIANGLADNTPTTETYTVIGYASKAYEPDNNTQAIWMTDVKGEKGDFFLKKTTVTNGIVSDDDYIAVVGKIEKSVYNSKTTLQIYKGSATILSESALQEIFPELDIRKVMMDNQVVVLKNGHLYNMSGQEIE